MADPTPPAAGSLLSLRTAVILFLAVASGTAVAMLTFAAGRGLALAALAGFAATGTALPVLHSLIDSAEGGSGT